MRGHLVSGELRPGVRAVQGGGGVSECKGFPGAPQRALHAPQGGRASRLCERLREVRESGSGSPPGGPWAVVLRTWLPVGNGGCSDEARGLQMQN